MSDQLKRVYHGKTIVSAQGKDGWNHMCDGKSFASLAEAIQYAKAPPKPKPQTEK